MTISVQYLEDPQRIEISQNDTEVSKSKGRTSIIIGTAEMADSICNKLEHLQTKFTEEVK